jgi:hypothetical protein
MNLADRCSMITAFMASAPATPAPASPCAVIAVSTGLALPALDRCPRKIGRPCSTRGCRPLAVPYRSRN